MTSLLLTPATLEDAVAAWALAPEADLLAGGTDLIPAQARGREPRGYLSLRAIPGLSGIAVDGPDVRIGALTTVAELMSAAGTVAPVLQRAARSLGSRQVRQRATLGGNVCAGGHQRSLVPALLALDATVDVVGPEGARTADLADVLTPEGPALSAGEIVVGFGFRQVTGPQVYYKIGPRNAVCYATAAVALVVDESAHGIRLALGGVNPAPVRVPEAEQIAAAGIDWAGRSVPADVAEAIGAAAAAAADPVPDHVATPQYRRHAVGVMARRAVARAFEEVPA